jgi:hypothetical protein
MFFIINNLYVQVVRLNMYVQVPTNMKRKKNNKHIKPYIFMGLFVEKKNIQPIVKLGSLPLTTNWCYFGNDDWQVSCIFYR